MIDQLLASREYSFPIGRLLGGEKALMRLLILAFNGVESNFVEKWRTKAKKFCKAEIPQECYVRPIDRTKFRLKGEL